jgi:hypothetical protein
VLKSFYLNRIFYYTCLVASGLFVTGYFFPPVFTVALAVILCTIAAVLVDTLLLYGKGRVLMLTVYCNPVLAMVMITRW